MIELDPGHKYKLHNIDGWNEYHRKELNILTFVKREGDKYPGNVGHYPGTILQELWRAEIARIKYLDAQVPCYENTEVMEHLRLCIYLLELRAAKRHGLEFTTGPQDIEFLPICETCGHIFTHTHEGALDTPGTPSSLSH